MKTFNERYGDELLTDNSKIKVCEQCKYCKYRDDGTVWSNDYRKVCCLMYQYPKYKPMGVIDCKEECTYYDEIEP